MGWTYFIVLAIGLTIGVVGGWQWGRAASSRLAADRPASLRQTEKQIEGQTEPIQQTEQTPDQTSDAESQILKAELQQMQLAYAMATEMERFKAGFLARSSHELRSPINSVISLHQLILSDLCEDPAEEREFIAQAQSAAEKMLSLLDRLISISKMIYGTEPLQIQSLQLELVLGEVQHFTQLQAQNRNLRLEIEPPDPDLYVLADSRWLRQILINLVDTPISLMQEGYIRLKTQVDWQTQQVHLWVEDQRPASFWRDPIDLMEEGRSPQLLQSPNREASAASNKESDALPSPGLNLLIIQTLLELMGGQLILLAAPHGKIDGLTEMHDSKTAIVASDGIQEIGESFTRIQCSLPLAPAPEAL